MFKAGSGEIGDATIQLSIISGGGGQVNNNISSKILVVLFSMLAMVSTSRAQVASSEIALEEVVVTAQRRSQSLQDVPISIDVISGETIDRQGYSFLRDMADFTPGIIIKNDFEEQGMMVRGNGNTGKNLSIEQAAPTFVDGIYFGLASQTMNAFLDVERLELLKGPQPVFFGQNAIAGALSITSRKPTPQWEGRAVLEYANNNSHRIEFGLGGPITDTLGIRVAGKLNQSDGYMKDIFTDGRFPFTREKAGRVILQWTPMEDFVATAKFEYATQDMGTGYGIACGINPVDTTIPSSIPFTGLEGLNFRTTDCATAEPGKFTDFGFEVGPTIMAPPDHLITANSNRTGMVDLTQLRPGDIRDDPLYFGNPPVEFFDMDFRERDEATPWNGLLNLGYVLNNGVELTSLTGFNRQVYQTVRQPFPLVPGVVRRWHTDYNSWSQEFRATSPADGTIAWMAGVYGQVTEADFSADAWWAEPTAFRGSRTFEDNRWLTAFATVTYNFMANKAAIDLGGRYSDIHKEGISYVHLGDWIIEHPVTGIPTVLTRSSMIPRGLHGAVALGRTPLRLIRTPQGEIDHGKFNPQIVLRYSATEDISLYAKWATGFKAGAFEVGGEQPPSRFVFDSEKAMIWETGARGIFWDGRASANLTLFWTEYKDLQVTSVIELPDGNRGAVTSNAARQRSRGLELTGRFLVTDRTTLGYSLSLLDSVMVEYPTATCQAAEQELGLCGPFNTIDRSGEPSLQAPDWQMALQLDHWIPVFDQHKVSFNANFIASDDYITDRNWARVFTMHDSQDLNLAIGFGDQEDTWELSVWARNILEKKPTYNPEFDVTGDGQLNQLFNSSAFMSYGLQLKYNYQ